MKDEILKALRSVISDGSSNHDQKLRAADLMIKVAEVFDDQSPSVKVYGDMDFIPDHGIFIEKTTGLSVYGRRTVDGMEYRFAMDGYDHWYSTSERDFRFRFTPSYASPIGEVERAALAEEMKEADALMKVKDDPVEDAQYKVDRMFDLSEMSEEELIEHKRQMEARLVKLQEAHKRFQQTGEMVAPDRNVTYTDVAQKPPRARRPSDPPPTPTTVRFRAERHAQGVLEEVFTTLQPERGGEAQTVLLEALRAEMDLVDKLTDVTEADVYIPTDLLLVGGKHKDGRQAIVNWSGYDANANPTMRHTEAKKLTDALRAALMRATKEIPEAKIKMEAQKATARHFVLVCVAEADKHRFVHYEHSPFKNVDEKDTITYLPLFFTPERGVRYDEIWVTNYAHSHFREGAPGYKWFEAEIRPRLVDGGRILVQQNDHSFDID